MQDTSWKSEVTAALHFLIQQSYFTEKFENSKNDRLGCFSVKRSGKQQVVLQTVSSAVSLSVLHVEHIFFTKNKEWLGSRTLTTTVLMKGFHVDETSGGLCCSSSL